jgi:hypothetical protein
MNSNDLLEVLEWFVGAVGSFILAQNIFVPLKNQIINENKRPMLCCGQEEAR